MVVKEGRFGPYVTDGTTNASLRKGDAVESIDMDTRLGTARRAPRRGTLHAKKKAAKKAAPAKKKAAAKKSPAKKAGAAKKTAAAKKAAASAGAAKNASVVEKATGAMKAAPTDPF